MQYRVLTQNTVTQSSAAIRNFWTSMKLDVARMVKVKRENLGSVSREWVLLFV